MTDSNDDDNRGRPRGRSDRPRAGGDRPRAGGDRPSKGREGGFKAGPKGGAKPFRAREGDERPRRPRPEGDRPFRTRDGEERPRKSREGGERPYRPRTDADRSFAARGGDERPRQPRTEARPRRAEPEAARTEAAEPAEERIAKVIARAGIASRRDAEAMIQEGRVTLNGTVLASPAINVTKDDRIEVDGEPLPAKERTRLWIFHKPRGLVTTARDPEGRPTVFDSLPEDLPRVVAVGRLDINTEGLLLLTNDGGLARVIAHPETGWLRRYKVRAHGEVTQADLDRLAKGVTVDGMDYGPVEARLDRVQGDNAWITLGLREGKNREVKRILEHLGLQVNRLIRLSFGPFQLGDLEPGLVEEVKTKILREQLGQALAAEAGVDFESPVREPIAPFGSPKAAEREERPARRERPQRPPREERFEDRPRRGFDEERPRGRREEEDAPKRPSRQEPRRSVWRAGEEAAEMRPARKAPRRGDDPKAARAAAAERPRERVGAIAGAEGRKVVVERLVSQPRDEEERPSRRPRGEGRPQGDREDRVRRGPAPGGRRPARDDRSEREDRAPRGRSAGPGRRDDDRPFRGRDGERPGRPGEDRPRRGPPGRGGFGGAKGGPRGGAKGGTKGGFKGGPRGGSKGPPRGRRP
ncbi:MAG TPA: pseudouridine synthase [Microvirga sp.]|nr:pseudouridine synthase [Microvirga sp.]